MSAVNSATSQQAVVEAALVLLERMGLCPADLAAVPQDRPVVPTFAEYVPVVSAAVSAGTRRVLIGLSSAFFSRTCRFLGDEALRRLPEMRCGYHQLGS